MRKHFPSPAEMPIPADCGGWEEMYPYHVLFSEDRRSFDESRFWFLESLHVPEPLYPFDTLTFDAAVLALNQANSRIFVVPPSLGVEYRILNGYVFASANSITDEATVSQRAELFATRGGFYYRHWDELYARWVEKVEQETRELQALAVPELPEVEDESVVFEARGVGSGHLLMNAYDRLLEGVDRIFQYHFEFLALGYGAYLAFLELCRDAFPDISDQSIGAMVSGIDTLVLRPDDELRRLATLAVELGVARDVMRSTSESELAAALEGTRCRHTMARGFRANEGSVVLLLVRARSVSPSPSIVD